MMPRPRQMPARFLEGAPAVVRNNVIDLIAVTPAMPLDFDVILRPHVEDQEVVGLDFGRDGSQGCHFFLKWWEARAFRERNRRKRVRWVDLPQATRNRIVAYLVED
jgi:hypothetical protein